METPPVAQHRIPTATSQICPVEKYSFCWFQLKGGLVTAPRVSQTSSGPVCSTLGTFLYFSNTSLSLQNCKCPPTAPCIPQDLTANLSCSDNVASTSWSYGQALGQLFRVTAVSTDGHKDECVSTETGCDLTGLLCGQYYTATALAEHSDCSSKPSNSITIKTGMCNHRPMVFILI